jgi:RNA polymerase sigma-70 factor (ECF subfamily)
MWIGAPHWSVVLTTQANAPSQGNVAGDELCRKYWYPVYAYVRQHGHSAQDAQDLTRDFFIRLLQKNSSRSVSRHRGKFRIFLVVALKYFLLDEWQRRHTRKRSVGQPKVSLAASLTESRYLTEWVDDRSADQIYERRWALSLQEQSLTRLRQELASADQAAAFDQLKGFLTAEKSSFSYTEAAQRLGLSEAALRMTVHRFRRRFRELFREDIAHTVARPEDIDEEMSYLFTVLNGHGQSGFCGLYKSINR